MKQHSYARPEILRNAHRQMRLRLCELHINLLQTKFPSAAADEALAALDTTLAHCEANTRLEDEFILARLQLNAAAMAADMEEEHEQEEDLIARLRYLVKRWKQTCQPRDAQAILYGLSDYIAFKFTHMNREERELMPMLWQQFNDDELMVLEQEMYATRLYIA